jgi:hypothetical protein
VVALRNVASPNRRVLAARGGARGFGAAIALGDLDGDGTSDLAIGSSDDSDAAPFAGEVTVFRGGADVASSDPWLVAVGDIRERGGFGASLAVLGGKHEGAWLLVGAPASSRGGEGGSIGAAFRWSNIKKDGR